MQLNMSFFINFFKGLFSNEKKGETPKVKPAAIKRTLPSTPINPMADEVENANTVTHDLIHEIEKTKYIHDESTDKQQETSIEVQPAIEAETEIKLALAPEPKVGIVEETLPATNVEPEQVESTIKEPEKAKSVAKAPVKKEAKPAAKVAVKKETKAKIKSTTNLIPKTIVLNEIKSSLTTKNKRIIGHSKSRPESFKVTHLVKLDQDKLRLNLTITDWDNIEGLSFVTYDIANDSIVFSKKCNEKTAAQLKDVLLTWAREVHKQFY